MILVRLFLIFLITLSFGGVIALADTLKVTGVLLDTNGKPASGYVVKLIVGTPRGIEASRDTTVKGIFEITKQDVDPDTIELWQLICLPDGKVAQEKVPFSRDERNANVWTARISLQLISLRQRRYSRSGATAAISQYTNAQNLRVQSGEIMETEANQLASMETAQILRHTELGDDLNNDLVQIYEEVVKTSGKSDLALSVFNKDYFLAIRENPAYQSYSPEVDKNLDDVAVQRKEIQTFLRSDLEDYNRSMLRATYNGFAFTERLGAEWDYTGRQLKSFNVRSIDPVTDPIDFTFHYDPKTLAYGGAKSARYVFDSAGSFTTTTKPDLIPDHRFSIKVQNTLFDIPSSFIKTPGPNFSYIGRPFVMEPKLLDRWNSTPCILQKCAVTKDQQIVILTNNGTWFYLDE